MFGCVRRARAAIAPPQIPDGLQIPEVSQIPDPRRDWVRTDQEPSPLWLRMAMTVRKAHVAKEDLGKSRAFPGGLQEAQELLEDASRF